MECYDYDRYHSIKYFYYYNIIRVYIMISDYWFY